jgi:hypothetical protein
MENVLPLRRGADKMPSDQDFSEWGGLDSNQRPTDYECDPGNGFLAAETTKDAGQHWFHDCEDF